MAPFPMTLSFLHLLHIFLNAIFLV